MTSPLPPNTPSPNDFMQLARVFFPYAEERKQHVQANGNRFVYYTTAEAAFLILRSRQVWLRNALLMNDFSEISHGFGCLKAAYSGAPGGVLKEALESAFPGLPNEVESMFNHLWPSLQTDTYVTCFSEHTAGEDARGRLSMWRAYGGRTGVAIVINGGVMHSESNALGAYTSPVFYGDVEEFGIEFMRVTRGIACNVPLLKRVGKAAVAHAVFHMLRFATLCTKHPAFQEEREWRVLASPSLFSSSRLLSSLELVRGVPQKVLKIGLENAPEEGLVGLALPELLNRIIIGPCEFPDVTAMAFVDLLTELGIPDPDDRVAIADVPLRYNA